MQSLLDWQTSLASEIAALRNQIAEVAASFPMLADRIVQAENADIVTRHLAFCAAAQAPNRLAIAREFERLWDQTDRLEPSRSLAEMAVQVQDLVTRLTSPPPQSR